MAQSDGRDRRRLAIVSLVAALVPLVVAAGRAIGEGWVPVGDSALIAIRARDVLGGGPGGDMPLLGMWASTSWSVGFDMNHPGPLLYALLAVPAALVGGGGGLVVGTAVLNAASVAGIFVVSRRVGGDTVAAAAMAVTALLCWSFGSAVLIEPWHATTVLLPFVCFVTLIWAVVSGDRACLPWAVVVGSLVLQTNLSYAVLVPALVVAAAIVVGVHARGAGDDRRGALVALGVSLAVGALCWAPVLVEQVTGEGGGNLSRLRRSLGETTETLGVTDGVRSVARVWALPPWWARLSYGEAFALGPFGNPLPSLAASAAGLAAVVAVGALAVMDARRRGDRVTASALALAGLLLAAGYVTALQTPTSDFGTVAYQLRWLWPVGAFVTLAFVVAVVRRPWASAPGRERWVLAALAGVTVVAGAANLPASHQETTAPEATYGVAREVTDAVGDAEVGGPVHVVCAEGVFDPYCEAVMARLQDDGVGFVVDDGIGVRQLGKGRRVDPAERLDQLIVVDGDFAIFPPPGADAVTVHQGLTEDERRELFFLRADLEAAIAAGEVRLDARGERVARAGGLVSVARDGDPLRIDPAAALDVRPDLFGTHRRDLVAMVHDDLIVADEGWVAPLARYVDLQDRWDTETVGVYLAPGPG
jgi:hypothetical protein